MPTDRDVPDFRPAERPGAARLSELSRSANATQREFNTRERLDPESITINCGHLLVSAAEGGVGRYTAKFLPFLEKSVDASTDISAEEIGTEGEDVLAINVGDIAGGENTIDPTEAPVYCWGHLVDQGSSDGRRVVSIMGNAGVTKGKLTPVKALAAGSGATAATDTWSLASDKKAVTIDITTRDYYDASGHHLYYFTRAFTFSSTGAVAAISSETRHTTDDAVVCT